MVSIYDFETKDFVVAGMLLLLVISIGGVAYNVYDTGVELKCRTGDGWTILETYSSEVGDYYKAQCQFKTKDWVTTFCSSFRSTASYARYGCDEVALVKIDNSVTTEVIINKTVTEKITINNYVNDLGSDGFSSGKRWVCPPNKAPCVLIEQ